MKNNELELIKNINDFEKKAANNDMEKILQIRDIIKQYDIIDFLKNVSSLILLPQNQSKSVIFQCMISTALSIREEEINFNIKMSYGKFKQIVRQFEELNIKNLIDPPEFPFALPIMYYKNYHLFMGMSVLPIDNIQAYMKIIIANRNKFLSQELVKINNIISIILTISEKVFINLKIEIPSLKNYNKDEIIYVPSSNILNLYKGFVSYSKNYLQEHFGNDIELLECKLGSTKINDALNFDEHGYYLTPFLKFKDEYIILDISLFPNTLMHKLIELTALNDKFNIINEFNNYMNYLVEEKFRILGNNKINEKQFEINLENNAEYNETLLITGNDGVIINCRIYDTGEKYDFLKSYNEYKSSLNKNYISNRIKNITSKLINKGIEKDKIFVIFTPVSIGRDMYFAIAENHMKNLAILSPYEINAISINERDTKMFFQRYINARKKLKYYKKNLFSELNFIALYINHNYSFYFNDDFDTKEIFLSIIGEYSYDYILKSYLKEDRHLVTSPDKNFMLEMIKLDDYLYFCYDLFFESKMNKLVEFNNASIWIITTQIIDNDLYNIYSIVIDLISFWLIELKELYTNLNFKISKTIEIYAVGKYEDFLLKKETSNNVEEILKYEIINNKLKIIITPEMFNFLADNGNEKEKAIMIRILNLLNNIEPKIQIENTLIEKIFKNQYKRKSLLLDVNTYPHLMPVDDNKFMTISSSDENLILDNIGLFLKANQNIEYGKISNFKISDTIRYVVDYLYNILTNKLKEFNKDLLIKTLYYEYEKIISNLLIRQDAYAYDIACYPTRKQDIDKNFNELNKTSVALKFLIELESSFVKTGDKKTSEYETEFLLAVSSQIIEWAYYNDLYYYNIIDTPIIFLNSNRLGFDKSILNKSGFSLLKARTEKMGMFGRERKKILSKFIELSEIDNVDFDNLFIKEFGYSFKDFNSVVIYLIDYGEKNGNLINKLEITDIEINLSNIVSNSIINKIITSLSLENREDFLNPPKPYRKEDVYPWRFNRELSFTRKPLILINNSIVWGSRTLSNSVYFLLNLINNGKLNAKSKEMKNYISLINNAKGKDFNNLVYNYIFSNKKFISKKNVTKINGKQICDEHNQMLGDIDILYISIEKGLIVLVETKNFELSKNFYEINNEYKNMFFDDGKNKSFLTKHKRRAEWIKEHLDDVKIEFNLPNKKWKVKYIFVMDEYLISKDLFNIKERIITINNLNEKELLRF